MLRPDPRWVGGGTAQREQVTGQAGGALEIRHVRGKDGEEAVIPPGVLRDPEDGGVLRPPVDRRERPERLQLHGEGRIGLPGRDHRRQGGQRVHVPVPGRDPREVQGSVRVARLHLEHEPELGSGLRRGYPRVAPQWKTISPS